MRIVSVVAATILAGCAYPVVPTYKPPTPERLTHRAPTCETPIACERLWIDATELVQAISGMRVRLATPGRVETFAANDYGRMTGIVVRYPTGPTTYDLRVSFECYRNTTCAAMQAKGINEFNRTLRGAPI